MTKDQAKTIVDYAIDDLKKKFPSKTTLEISKLFDNSSNPAILSQDDKNSILKAFGVKQFWLVLKQMGYHITGKRNDLFEIKKVQNTLENNAIIIDSTQKKVTKEQQTQLTIQNESKTQKTIDKMKCNKNIHDRIESLLKELNKGLIEKNEAMRLALLAAVSGESIFFLGLPGTAKSMVSRRLKLAFDLDEKNSYFEYLMNQFSTPDEVFGPVSLKALENDEYKRIVDGYLPTAEIAFLDEIWKASPAIQNTLLTIINEKKFHNGNEVMNVPLKVLVAASNELPTPNMGLEALWDRFLLRLIVNPVSENSFFDVVLAPTKNEEPATLNKITANELKQWQDEIDKIEVPEDIRNVITSIREEVQLYNQKQKDNKADEIYVSDRRWKKIIHILRTSAFLNRRDAVDLMDLQLIEYCIWNNSEQIEYVKNNVVRKCIGDNGLNFSMDLDDLENEIKEFDDYVSKQFYVKQDKLKMVKMNTGDMAYELVSPFEYSWDDVYYISQTGGYYKQSKDVIGKNVAENVTELPNKISLQENGRPKEVEIKMVKEEGNWVKDSNVFNFKYELRGRQEEANKTFDKIKQNVDDSKQNIETFEKENGQALNENLFADSEVYKIVFKEIAKTKLDLEKIQKKLEDVRKRYME